MSSISSEHLELCLSVLTILESDTARFQYFSAPAVTSLSPEEATRYLAVISQPIDLGTIRRNMLERKYGSIAAFREDGAYMM